MRRVRTGDLVAGVAGAVLLASLFLNWYSVTPEIMVGATDRQFGSVSAWTAFSVVDVLLALVALLGIAG